MWPAWNQTAVAAVVIVVLLLATRTVRRRGFDQVRAFARELVVVLILYSIWQYVGSLSLKEFGNAFANGRWIWRAEHTLHLPSELALQHSMIAHRALTQAAD